MSNSKLLVLSLSTAIITGKGSDNCTYNAALLQNLARNIQWEIIRVHHTFDEA